MICEEAIQCDCGFVELDRQGKIIHIFAATCYGQDSVEMTPEQAVIVAGRLMSLAKEAESIPSTGMVLGEQ